MSRLEALRRYLGGGRVAAGDELSKEGASILERGGTPDEIEHVLFDFWIDMDHRAGLTEATVTAGLVRTAEVWSRLWSKGDFRFSTADALNRAVWVLFKRRGEVGVAAQGAFKQCVIAHTCDTYGSIPASVAPNGVWVLLANSVVSIWPDAQRLVLSPLWTPSGESWHAAFHYISALAYPTPDHPTSTKPIELWERLGESDGVRWSPDSAQVLDERLGGDELRGALATIAKFSQLGPERAEVEACLEEIVEIQLESDLARRRVILLSKLQQACPDASWDDELGMRMS